MSFEQSAGSKTQLTVEHELLQWTNLCRPSVDCRTGFRGFYHGYLSNFRLSLLPVFIGLAIAHATAQITGSGTAGTIPVFTGTSSIGNSNPSVTQSGTTTTFSGHVAGTASVTAPQLGPWYIADQYSGSDCGAKINAAITASGGTGTIVVGPGCPTTISTTVNPSGKPVAIQFTGGAASYFLSAPIIVGSGGSVSGPSSSQTNGSLMLQAVSSYSATCPADPAGTSYSALICMDSASSLHDLIIDGNKGSPTPGANYGVLVQNANSVKIYNATIQNAQIDDLYVTNTHYPTVMASQSLILNDIYFLYSSTGGPYLYKVTTAGTGTSSYPSCSPTSGSTCTWGSATFTNESGQRGYPMGTYDNTSSNGWLGPNVLLRNAGQDDMFTERNADWTVSSTVQFELATRDGFHCEDCVAYRFLADDFGANGRYGAYSAVVSGQCSTNGQTGNHFFIGSQFGGNTSGDIWMSGRSASAMNFCTIPSTYQWAGGDTITGNQFIEGSSSAPNSVSFVDAGGNNLSGNTWGGPYYGFQYNYLVSSSFILLSGNARQPTRIHGTTLEPISAGAFSIFTATDPYSLTSGVDVADVSFNYGQVDSWGTQTFHGNIVPDAGISIPNSVPLYFVDTHGGVPQIAVNSGNNWTFTGTNASGSNYTLFSAPMHTTNATVTFNTPVNGASGFQYNGTSGYTGTKTAGSCTFTIQGGIITNVTGC